MLLQKVVLLLFAGLVTAILAFVNLFPISFFLFSLLFTPMGVIFTHRTYFTKSVEFLVVAANYHLMDLRFTMYKVQFKRFGDWGLLFDTPTRGRRMGMRILHYLPPAPVRRGSSRRSPSGRRRKQKRGIINGNSAATRVDILKRSPQPPNL